MQISWYKRVIDVILQLSTYTYEAPYKATSADNLLWTDEAPTDASELKFLSIPDSYHLLHISPLLLKYPFVMTSLVKCFTPFCEKSVQSCTIHTSGYHVLRCSQGHDNKVEPWMCGFISHGEPTCGCGRLMKQTCVVNKCGLHTLKCSAGHKGKYEPKRCPAVSHGTQKCKCGAEINKNETCTVNPYGEHILTCQSRSRHPIRFKSKDRCPAKRHGACPSERRPDFYMVAANASTGERKLFPCQQNCPAIMSRYMEHCCTSAANLPEGYGIQFLASRPPVKQPPTGLDIPLVLPKTKESAMPHKKGNRGSSIHAGSSRRGSVAAWYYTGNGGKARMKRVLCHDIVELLCVRNGNTSLEKHRAAED